MKNKENEKAGKYLDHAGELKKAIDNERDGDTSCNQCTGNDPQRLGKGAVGVRIRRTSRDQLWWGQPEYWEESWRLEETCSHLDSSERPSADADMKRIIIIMIIWEWLQQID